jgi:hypothetical protein
MNFIIQFRIYSREKLLTPIIIDLNYLIPQVLVKIITCGKDS